MSFLEFSANLANPVEDELEFASELAEVLPSGHDRNVASTILRSVRSLPDEGQDSLRLAALLAVAPIPPILVVAAFQRADSLNDSQAKRRTIRAFQQVERASLAERGDSDTRVVHMLVSHTMRFHEATPERPTALRAAAVAALNGILRENGTHPLKLQHARALVDGSEIWDAETATLALRVSGRDADRGLYAPAQTLLQRVTETRERLLGPEHPDTLMTMNKLAEMLWAQGELASAKALQERVVETSRRVLGDEDADTLANMSNLAEILEAQGNLSEARGCGPMSVRRSGSHFIPPTYSRRQSLAAELEEGRLSAPVSPVHPMCVCQSVCQRLTFAVNCALLFKNAVLIRAIDVAPTVDTLSSMADVLDSAGSSRQ
jgi:hypothetical protein